VEQAEWDQLVSQARQGLEAEQVGLAEQGALEARAEWEAQEGQEPRARLARQEVLVELEEQEELGRQV
jgi:hypothetical protein